MSSIKAKCKDNAADLGRYKRLADAGLVPAADNAGNGPDGFTGLRAYSRIDVASREVLASQESTLCDDLGSAVPVRVPAAEELDIEGHAIGGTNTQYLRVQGSGLTSRQAEITSA